MDYYVYIKECCSIVLIAIGVWGRMDGHDYAGSFGTPMFINAVNEAMVSERQ